MIKIIFLIGIILIFYWFVPYLITRVFGIGVIKRKGSSTEVAFTFDDGPNPVYTPQILDLLKRHQIKATFFVLGSKAEKYPEIIKRIYDEGHLLGIHNFVHRANWGMSPWKVRRDLEKSAFIIEKITEERPIYYRPPWGLLNLFDLFLLKKYKIILWSVMAEDWRSNGGSEKVKNRLLHQIKKGDVVLLHDCGTTWGADEDAPMNTIMALNDVFNELSKMGISCVRIDEM
ncbi:polysaccharide deacetylase family protein [Neobacillus sp. LXY-1]|uniref:polysaccharide deacetylase family protein n=1 Tax=Neobacillus sp. LXY-1 TaxID=3379133 RepID=UPI003EE1ABCF